MTYLYKKRHLDFAEMLVIYWGASGLVSLFSNNVILFIVIEKNNKRISTYKRYWQVYGWSK